MHHREGGGLALGDIELVCHGLRAVGAQIQRNLPISLILLQVIKLHHLLLGIPQARQAVVFVWLGSLRPARLLPLLAGSIQLLLPDDLQRPINRPVQFVFSRAAYFLPQAGSLLRRRLERGGRQVVVVRLSSMLLPMRLR